MKIELNPDFRQRVERFFEKNPGIPHAISQKSGGLIVEWDSASISVQQSRRIAVHFKYLDLFEWRQGDLEEVIFWERPEKFALMADDFASQIQSLDYDLIAPIEARGFLLAGVLAGQLSKPILPIRKHKTFFDHYPGVKVPFTNWKGEQEALFIPRREANTGQAVLVVDDLIETGNSLEAALVGLVSVGCRPIGAFYLCDVMSPDRLRDFNIPIHSFVKATPEEQCPNPSP